LGTYQALKSKRRFREELIAPPTASYAEGGEGLSEGTYPSSAVCSTYGLLQPLSDSIDMEAHCNTLVPLVAQGFE